MPHFCTRAILSCEACGCLGLLPHLAAVPQVFPYFYVPYDDDLPSEPAAAHAYLRSLAQGIEVGMRANSQVRLCAICCTC